MDDTSQLLIPESFQALYLDPLRHRPRIDRQQIAARYELCEDLAQVLTEPALARLHGLGITEADVLERTLAGLRGPDTPVAPGEARWVVQRLAELLNWPALSEGEPPIHAGDTA